MKRFLLLLLAIGLFISNPSNLFGFPWPDLGEAKVIEPGPPGTINDMIHYDTTATGERAHHHYILKRGYTYLYTARINNSGWPLMVTAEEGDGPLPIIKALGPAPGEDEAERIFHAQGDLYIKDLVLNGWDQGGNYTDNATVRLAADSITVVCDNIIFDFNRQNNLRINAKACSLYVENCIIANQGVSERLWQGFAVHFRGNPTPIVHFRNNTIYNMHNTVFTNRNIAKYNKLIIESNTFVNTGTGGSYFGRPDSLIVKNNLFVNIGILGDGIVGDRSEFVEPYYFFTIDSNFVDDALVEPYVDFYNNHFYNDPAVSNLLPDSSKKATLSLFHPHLEDLLGDNNIIKDEAFPFTNFPAEVSEYDAYINDFYEFADEPAQMPAFYEDFREMDFSYPTSHEAYTAHISGGPLGDRNWFPEFLGVEPEISGTFNIYPNPVTDVMNFKLKDNQEVNKVVISNVLGQQVITVQNLKKQDVHTVQLTDLNTGIYFVNFYLDNTLLRTSKIIKK